MKSGEEPKEPRHFATQIGKPIGPSEIIKDGLRRDKIQPGDSRINPKKPESKAVNFYDGKYMRIMNRIDNFRYDEPNLIKEAQNHLDMLWNEDGPAKRIIVARELDEEVDELNAIIADKNRFMPREYSEKYSRYYAYMHFLAGLKKIQDFE